MGKKEELSRCGDLGGTEKDSALQDSQSGEETKESTIVCIKEQVGGWDEISRRRKV